MSEPDTFGRAKLHVVRSGGAEGIPILFLNSLAADVGMWDEVAARMGQRPAVRFDARGHGQSGEAAEPYTLEALGVDALGVLDGLGMERAILCGLSLGGLVAQWLATKAPERVAGLVLANTASSFPPATMWHERIAMAEREGMAPLVAATLDRWLTEDFRAAHQERTDAMAAMIARTSPTGYAGCAAVLAKADTTALLGQIACPTLVLVGDQDKSTPPDRGEALVAAIGGARLATLRAAHLSAVEDADGFVAALLAFIDEVAA